MINIGPSGFQHTRRSTELDMALDWWNILPRNLKWASLHETREILSIPKHETPDSLIDCQILSIYQTLNQ